MQQRKSHAMSVLLCAALIGSGFLAACASDIPYRPVPKLSPAEQTDDKFPAVNQEKKSPVVYIKLDDDILRPMRKDAGETLPTNKVGPFELRDETLASALELVMGNKKIPMSFQTNQAMTRTVTMTGLEGPLDQVVDKLCSLADLYCSYESGALVLKDTETFTVSLPPFIAENYEPFVNGVKAITGGQTYVDGLTRTLVYTTTHRNHVRARDYFERLRSNTAMIVYEMQIWEVTLNDDNQLGIDWNNFDIGKFNLNLTKAGTTDIAGGIGLGTQLTGSGISVDAVINFLRTQGAIKTISQPQLTVLSGSSAKLRVGNSQDYVSQITRTVGISTNDNVSVTTSKLETGLNLEISSAWDNSTVYGELKVDIQNLLRLDQLDVGTTSIQLPQTSDRSIETKLRVRPGDALIIAGIVEERNEISQEGIPGRATKPLLLTNKGVSAANTELVFMLRPRVVVFTDNSNSPDAAQLSPGGLRAEPARLQNKPAVLPMPEARVDETALTPVPAAQPVILKPVPLSEPALSDYLDNLPTDEIAPTP